MRVKVGDRLYDGETERVMVILSPEDRQHIANMDMECTKLCQYPDGRYSMQELDNWMGLSKNDEHPQIDKKIKKEDGSVEPFWMVWCPAGHAPTVKHLTPEHAQKEAERLAMLNEDDEFFVLQVVARCKRVKPVAWDRVSQDNADIPF